MLQIIKLPICTNPEKFTQNREEQTNTAKSKLNNQRQPFPPPPTNIRQTSPNILLGNKKQK